MAMEISDINVTGYATLTGGVKIPPVLIPVQPGAVDVRNRFNLALFAAQPSEITLQGEQWQLVILSVAPGSADITIGAATLHAGDAAQLICTGEDGQTWQSIAQ
jgi:hypothetical protein